MKRGRPRELRDHGASQEIGSLELSDDRRSVSWLHGDERRTDRLP